MDSPGILTASSETTEVDLIDNASKIADNVERIIHSILLVENVTNQCGNLLVHVQKTLQTKFLQPRESDSEQDGDLSNQP